MGIKSTAAKIFAYFIAKKTNRDASNALSHQLKWFSYLIQYAKATNFGKEHQFETINTYDDFVLRVKVKDYEGLKNYFDAIACGEADVMWPGKPIYLAKTSGTTSGIKYIPISKESIKYHIQGARNALLCYIAQTGSANFVNGKLIFLSGSPVLDTKSGIHVGRLSGIVNHHVPAYLRKNQMPSYTTNCIEDWETKVDEIVKETFNQNMTLISGIPPWVQMYFDKLSAKGDEKKITEIFKKLELFVYGGVNYEPYRAKIEHSLGKKINTIETYPASEGFIAYQNNQHDSGLLLLTNSGIFYEFIATDDFFNENPKRIWLKEVELNKNYVLILNTNAGLFGYNIGDTVKFVSLNPYKIVVTGRIKHFISAFGEHVIGEEVEFALMQAAKKHQIKITEFTVAPQVNPPEGGLPYHEWFIEFENMPIQLNEFALEVDKLLQQKNIYYKDLISGQILRPLKITPLPPNSFIDYMRRLGKLGGQNKVPRLSNNRKMAEELISERKEN